MIVAATGHRPFQKDYKTQEWVSKLEYGKVKGNSIKLFQRLVAMYEMWFEVHPEVTVAISGLAMGVDLAFAQAAINKGIPVHAYLPYTGHGDEWKTFYKQVHRHVLDSATEIFDAGVDYSREALLQRNKDMVAAADLILALWDGTAGGTGHCVKHAMSVGKPVTNLWKSWLKYREMAEEDDGIELGAGYV